MKEALTFKDVQLAPTRVSTVVSRHDVDTSTVISPTLTLQVPLISSPMPAINAPEFFVELHRLGGIGTVHRFQPVQDQLEQGIVGRTIMAVGLFNAPFPFTGGPTPFSEEERYEHLASRGHKHFLIDVANGFSKNVEDTIKVIKNDGHFVMCGNVCDAAGYIYLAGLGVDAVRVGVGTGHVCTTRTMTGVGVPIITALDDCRYVRSSYGFKCAIIADGGVNTPADMVKAIRFGADAVMMGYTFARTIESSGRAGRKAYEGAASFAVQQRAGKQPTSIIPEGETLSVTADLMLEDVVSIFEGGLRSGMSYLNAHTIPQLKGAGQAYRVVSPNSEGWNKGSSTGVF